MRKVIVVPGADIVIPRSHIQVFGELVVIETIEPAHVIVGDPNPGRKMLAQDIDLVFLELAVRGGDEALEFEHQPGVMRADGDRDLIPIGCKSGSNKPLTNAG